MYDCRIVFPVCEILRARGLDAEDVFPGYIRIHIQKVEHIIYPTGPSGSFWHHEPDDKESHSLGISSHSEDPKDIASAILSHLAVWRET